MTVLWLYIRFAGKWQAPQAAALAREWQIGEPARCLSVRGRVEGSVERRMI
jgi:hypothetical protein